MASIRKEIQTNASADAAWSALRDVGALHTRLVPGFVVNTELEPGARVVTFGNGMVVREVIVDLNEAERRVAWSATGGRLSHHNASAQVLVNGDCHTKVVWIADLLPDDMRDPIEQMMEQGMAVMKATLDRTS